MPPRDAKREQRRKEILALLDLQRDPPTFDGVEVQDFIDREKFRIACADAILRYRDARANHEAFKSPAFSHVEALANRTLHMNEPALMVEEARRWTAQKVFHSQTQKDRPLHDITGSPLKSQHNVRPWELNSLIQELSGLFLFATTPKAPTRANIFRKHLPILLRVAHWGDTQFLCPSGAAIKQRFKRAGGTHRAEGLIIVAIRPDLGFPASEWTRRTHERYRTLGTTSP